MVNWSSVNTTIRQVAYKGRIIVIILRVVSGYVKIDFWTSLVLGELRLCKWYAKGNCIEALNGDRYVLEKIASLFLVSGDWGEVSTQIFDKI